MATSTLPQYTTSEIWQKCFHGMQQFILVYTCYKLLFPNIGSMLVGGLNLTLGHSSLTYILVKLAPVLHDLHQYRQE